MAQSIKLYLIESTQRMVRRKESETESRMETPSPKSGSPALLIPIQITPRPREEEEANDSFQATHPYIHHPLMQIILISNHPFLLNLSSFNSIFISASPQCCAAATDSPTPSKAYRPLPPPRRPRRHPRRLRLLRPRPAVQRAREARRRRHPASRGRHPRHRHLWGCRLSHMLVLFTLLSSFHLSPFIIHIYQLPNTFDS